MQRIRRILPLTLLLSLLVQPAFAQKAKQAETEELYTPTGVRLALTYWESPEGQESPLLVLLHGEKGNRKKWDSIAKRFQSGGYAVIALDLRKHGDSAGAPTATPDGKKSDEKFELKTIDYLGMAADDMDGLKAYIYKKHQDREFNMRKTGIVAVGPMCHVAILAAGRDWLRTPHPDGVGTARTPRGQDVQTVTLISPESSLKGIKLNDPLRLLKGNGVAFYVIVGGKDKEKKKAADRMYKSLTSRLKDEDKTARMFYYHPDVKLNGENLLRKYEKGLFEKMKQFHDLKLDAVQQPWRDRQSKLEK